MKETSWRQLRISTTQSDGEKYCDNNIVTSRYTVITFFPKVLYELFRRISNFFFLALIILQLSLSVPTDPSAYIAAFTVVIVVSLIKQGYEDWVRHKADDNINQTLVHVIQSNGSIKKKKSRELRVGQVIQLGENDAVPADILLLSCVDSSGNGVSKCEITTANLDGEPNRKLRQCPSSLPKMTTSEEVFSFLNSASLSIEYDEPNADLYKLNGLLLRPNEKHVGITMENVLLRGTTIKNIQFVFGCIIYSGKDSRLALNTTRHKRNKFSVVEAATNKLVYLMFAILLVLCSIITGLFYWNKNSIWFTQAWYLPVDEDSEIWQGVTTFLLFLILMSYIIPISLSVTIELQKFGCSLFFGWDEDMTCGQRGIGATCNTSDLNEELGQINYLLTDKTGTLTENNLKFASASVGGIIYGPEELARADSEEKAEFLEALALCHTVHLIPHSDDSIEYQGESPDEEILVTTAHSLGVTYLGEDDDGWMSIQSNIKHRKRFRRHILLEFDSDRKAMSVILEDEQGRIFLISKGAESTLLPKCQQSSSPETPGMCAKHVTEFANKGFRTLVVAKKEIRREDLNKISHRMETLRRQPAELQSFYAEIESDLTILGVTGVEDELQENVQETLRMLNVAGIRTWMLTGDKLETAINIGISCSLVTNTSNIITVTEITDSAHLKKELEAIEIKLRSAPDMTLVIDGAAFAIGFLECSNLLAKVVMSSSQVIFCRMAPVQKAQVVKLIKSTKEGKHSRVCAVGDGGNDVAMIQEAHIGIGIKGREGRQASRAADFAVPNFQCLQKAILVHGSWYYTRTATMVLFFFYRGLAFVLPQLFYGIDSGFSGQTIYHASYMMMYSLSFASLPILIYGIMEQHKSAEQLLSFPAAYAENARNALMSWRSGGIWWTCMLIWHLFLIYYVPRLIWPEQHQLMDWGMFSHFLGGVVVAVTDISVACFTVYFTWITLFGQVASYLTVLVFYTLSSEVLKGVGGGELKYVYFELLSQVHFWAVIVLVSVLSILPDLVYGGIRRLHILQERKDTGKQEHKL